MVFMICDHTFIDVINHRNDPWYISKKKITKHFTKEFKYVNLHTLLYVIFCLQHTENSFNGSSMPVYFIVYLLLSSYTCHKFTAAQQIEKPEVLVGMISVLFGTYLIKSHSVYESN